MKKPFLMEPTIVLDFDDTLISTNRRQYEVIKSFFDGYNIVIDPFDEYIHYRKTFKATNVNFANRFITNSDLKNTYRDYFIKNIESDVFLRYDQLIVDLNLIRKVSTKINLVLLSLRSSREQGIKQLIKLGLKDCFNEILFVKHEIYNPKIEVLNNLKLQTQEITFVGDSINDYEAARESGVDFIGVGTGLFILPENLNILDNINVYLEKLI